jgi:hypothetical protein
MTDRELLELAAKAANIKLCWGSKTGGIECPALLGVIPWTWWNPLTDDGDALRLAVKLAIDIEFFVESGTTSAVQVEHCDCRCNIGRDEVTPKGDPCAAARRAIVRASAEIGKGMK